MNLLKSVGLLTAATAVAAIAGCGSDNRESSTTASFTASQACIGCHSAKTSTVTGNLIAGEWQESAHNTKNGAACDDCHTNSGHPDGGSIVKAVSDAQCLECHTVARLSAPHFAQYTTSLAAQYVSQHDAATVQCRGCHNPHDTTSLMQYNRDWAESGHGDVHYVPGAADESSVNSHYAWTTVAREACAKCHTTVGNIDYTSGGTAPYGSTNKKNEAITCKACHDDYSWTRRSLGAVTLDYNYSAVPVVLPDGGDSGVCFTCHAGRGNMQSNRSTRIPPHYFVAAATIYAANTHVGYEFDGKSYAAPSYFKHNIAGLQNGDTAGPCVACHMKSTNSHKFEVVTKDANGRITAINSQAECNKCHTGAYAITAAKLEEEAADFASAKALLTALVGNTVTNYKGAAVNPTTTAAVNALSAGDYGAWYNMKLMGQEPGIWAHNRFYAKRLIFDSIDWMDNGALNNTISINTTTYGPAAKWFGWDGVAAGPYTATRP